MTEMGLNTENYNWDLSDYIVDNNFKNLIARIAVEPIHRSKWFFYIFKDNNHYKLLSSYVTDEECWELLRKVKHESFNDKKITIAEIFKTDIYNDTMKKFCGVYEMKIDNEYINTAIEEIKKLNFDTPLRECLGLDGFDLYFNLINGDKEFRTWCSSNNEYYYRIIELVNYLLSCVIYDDEYYFEVPHQKKIEYTYKVIQNPILFDEERLIRQFKLKFENRNEYKNSFNEIFEIFSNMSIKKKCKANYNLRTSYLEYTNRTKNILNYISNQSEDEIKIFDWCGYENDFENKYGDEFA